MRRFGLMLGAVVAVAALTAARPVSELDLLTRLNGQPMRWVLPDAGRSGLYVSSGQACAALTGGTNQNGVALTPNVVLFVPEGPVNLCIRPQVDQYGGALPWDGGCNTLERDENFGVPLQQFQPYYFVPSSKATQVCAASDAGTVQGALYNVQ